MSGHGADSPFIHSSMRVSSALCVVSGSIATPFMRSKDCGGKSEEQYRAQPGVSQLLVPVPWQSGHSFGFTSPISTAAAEWSGRLVHIVQGSSSSESATLPQPSHFLHFVSVVIVVSSLC
jgi:hypothetical protein